MSHPVPAVADPPSDGEPGTSLRPTNLTCPRCGYDVSGPVSTWAESCPVEGVCTECGLAFRWKDVLDPICSAPAWFYEFARRQRAWAYVRTLACVLLPWTFWRLMKLWYPVRRRRLVSFLVATCLVAWVVVAACGAYVDDWMRATPVRLHSANGHPSIDIGGIIGPLLNHGTWFLTQPTRYREFEWSVQFMVPLLVFALTIPLCFLLIGDSLARVKVRAGHVWRAAVYTTAGALVLLSGFTALRAAAAWSIYAILQSPSGPFGPFMSRAWDVAWWILDSQWELAPVGAAWFGLSWWVICRRYLRLPQPLWVAALFSLVATLMVMLYMALCTDTIIGILFRSQW